MKKNWLDSKTLKYILIVLCLIMTFSMYMQRRKKNYFKEAARLPFYNIQATDLEDGTYPGKIYTSFIHIQLEVTVKDHKLTNIKIIENEGLGGKQIEPLLAEMIEKNNSVVTALKGDELASIVFIACVDNALFNGLPLQRQKELNPDL